MTSQPKILCRINDKYAIQMANCGWMLLNQEKQFSRSGSIKKTATKITHHPTLQQLCEWVINREAGLAEDFNVLLQALNAKSDWLRITLEKELKND